MFIVQFGNFEKKNKHVKTRFIYPILYECYNLILKLFFHKLCNLIIGSFSVINPTLYVLFRLGVSVSQEMVLFLELQGRYECL